MDKIERAQIRLLFEHLGAECRAKAAEQNNTMHANHSAQGVLQSGGTVRAALGIAEELANTYVADVVAAVAEVVKDAQAFNMIVTDVTIMIQDLQPSIDQAVKLATAGGSGGHRFDSVGKEANRLFRELQVKTLRQLELHRFSFTRSSPEEPKGQVSTQLPPPQFQPKNQGGKPLAAHWDDMWAEIAVLLWEGDLKPTKQKDISDAMFAWLSDNGIDAGQTAVTERARALWLKIEPKLRG